MREGDDELEELKTFGDLETRGEEVVEIEGLTPVEETMGLGE